ncbi:hypothetical protein V8E51_019967 [Hyaloscypha variabilis]
MDNDQMSSLDSQSSNVRNTYAAVLNVHDQGRSGDLGEDAILDNFLQYSALPVSNMSTSTRDCSISNQQHLDAPLSAWAATNNHVTDGFLDTFSETGFSIGALDDIEVSGFPPPEANTSRMATTEANVLPETRMIPSNIERHNSMQTPVGGLNTDFANGHQSRRFSSSDFASAEDAPNAFFKYDFNVGHFVTSGFTTTERSD